MKGNMIQLNKTEVSCMNASTEITTAMLCHVLQLPCIAVFCVIKMTVCHTDSYDLHRG